MVKLDSQRLGLSTLSLAVLLTIALVGFSFVTQSDGDVASGIRYEESISTSYNINPNDFERLYDFEKVGLKQIEEKRYVETTLDANNNLTTVITIAYTNAYEEGMPAPARIVMDKQAVTIFDRNGSVMDSRVLTSEEQLEHQRMGTLAAERGLLPSPSFKNLTPEESNTLSNSGATVNITSDGYTIRNGNKELKCNLSDNFIGIKEFAADGKITSELSRNYLDSPYGKVPNLKQEVEYSVLPSGVHAARVKNTLYSNYQKF